MDWILRSWWRLSAIFPINVLILIENSAISCLTGKGHRNKEIAACSIKPRLRLALLCDCGGISIGIRSGFDLLLGSLSCRRGTSWWTVRWMLSLPAVLSFTCRTTYRDKPQVPIPFSNLIQLWPFALISTNSLLVKCLPGYLHLYCFWR